jgi:Rps23 Pro-64 3,4-dihydroxylase Tpa1-like proline 4-hydroxylase
MSAQRFELLRGASGRALVARFRDLGDGIDPDLREQILSIEDRFVDASIGGAREDWRIGHVVYDPPEAAERITARVRAVAVEVARALDVDLPQIADVERQLTSYGDGGYYKVHTD